MAEKFVYDFQEGNKDMKDLLGGKGANLAEMTSMGLPVPHGFTVTCEACNAYRAAGRQFPSGMLEEVAEPPGAAGEGDGPPSRRPGATRCWSRSAPAPRSRCRG